MIALSLNYQKEKKIMSRKKIVLAISGLFLSAIVVSACASASTAATAPAAATQAPVKTVDASKATSAADFGGMEGLIKAAQAEGKLTTITLPRDWCNYGEIMDTFGKKYGIELTNLNPEGGSADEIEAIKANKDSKGPQAPDVIDIGLAYGPQSKQDGLITPYKVIGWDTIPADNKDAEGYYYGDYYGVMTIQVNADAVKDVPKDWKDLLDPKYKGQVALAGDPRASNQAAQTVYAAALANGGSLDNVGPGLEYFKQLNAAGNLLPVIADSGTFAKGETPITFAWDYLGLAAKENNKDNPTTLVIIPKSGQFGGYYVQAISAYAPHPAAARLWEEYLYSDEGQLLLLKGFCHGMRYSDLAQRGVVPAELAARVPAPESYAKAVFPNLDQLSKVREDVKNQWDSVVGVNYSK
jgi:putative spermidine/putrescine transport system substrate-binding protein